MAKRLVPQDDQRAKAMPTEKQIREVCQQIQDRWSEGERRKRAGCYAEEATVKIPVARDLGDELEFEDE